MLSYNPGVAKYVPESYTPAVQLPDSMAATLRITMNKDIHCVTATDDGSLVAVTVGSALTYNGTSTPYYRFTSAEVRIYSVDSSQNYTLVHTQTNSGGLSATNFGQSLNFSQDGQRLFIQGWSNTGSQDIISLRRNPNNTFTLDQNTPLTGTKAYSTSVYFIGCNSSGNIALIHDYNLGSAVRVEWSGTSWVTTGSFSSLLSSYVHMLEDDPDWVISRNNATLTVYNWNGSQYIAVRSYVDPDTSRPQIPLNIKDINNIVCTSIRAPNTLNLIDANNNVVMNTQNAIRYSELRWNGSSYSAVYFISDIAASVSPGMMFGASKQHKSISLPPNVAANTTGDSSYYILTLLRYNTNQYREENSVLVTGPKPVRFGDYGSTYPTYCSKQGRCYLNNRNNLRTLYTIDIPVTPTLIGN